MSQRQHDLESLVLAMFAAVPLYATHAVGAVPLLAFHLTLGAMFLRVASGRSPEILPARVMRIIAVTYVLFYVLDAALISRDAIAASTHLVLFIAVYQPIESMRSDNRAQRILTAALIATAGVATSTHITIVLFLCVFVFLTFRQMMHVSHAATEKAIGRQYEEPASFRSAAFYLAGSAVIGILLFPILPRVRNPFVRGMAGALTNATTGLSDSIDFSSSRATNPDAAVVARVWMGAEATPFFTPLRLRGPVYDRYIESKWQQSSSATPRQIQRSADDGYLIGRPSGFTATVTVQQRLVRKTTLYVPSGTYAVSGLPQISERPRDGSYSLSAQPATELLTYRARVSRQSLPLRFREPRLVEYPLTPPVVAMARRIAGSGRPPLEQAAAVERYMSSNFRYVPDPGALGRPMTVDEFLLREHRGHCEYFAAGMVTLMTALNVPARIVGGFYGGRFNPLTGQFVLRREDAHAWVEVWDGAKWVTFDATPPDLRPGSGEAGWLRTYVTAIGDSITYFWDRYILTFGLSDQVTLAVDLIVRTRDGLRNLRSGMTRAASSFTMSRFVGGLAFLALMAMGFLAARRRRSSLFSLLVAHLRKRGIEVGPAMTIEEALRTLRAGQPGNAEQLAPLIALYEAERFSRKEERGRGRAIRRGLAALR